MPSTGLKFPTLAIFVTSNLPASKSLKYTTDYEHVIGGMYNLILKGGRYSMFLYIVPSTYSTYCIKRATLAILTFQILKGPDNLSTVADYVQVLVPFGCFQLKMQGL